MRIFSIVLLITGIATVALGDGDLSWIRDAVKKIPSSGTTPSCGNYFEKV